MCVMYPMLKKKVKTRTTSTHIEIFCIMKDNNHVKNFLI